MRRPVVLVTVAFLFGVILHELGPWPAVAALFLIACAVLIGPTRHRQALLLLMMTAVVALIYTHVRWLERQHPLPMAINGETLTVEGAVLGPPEQRPGGQRFLLLASQISDSESTWSWGGTVQVTVAEPLNQQQAAPRRALEIAAGERLRITGNWRLFGGPRNPGEPDWSLAMARRGISGSLWSEQDTVVVLGAASQVPWWQRWSWDLRQRVVAIYQRYVPSPHDAVLAGLTLGVDDRIPEEMVEDFASAGVLHLLAVSGGNVAFVVSILLIVLRRAPIPLWLENAMLLVAIWLFTLVTGGEASVVRASLMAGLLIAARWLLRSPEFISIIALTTLLMLIFDPYSCYAAGFQLSFAAVIGLALWTTPFEARLSRLPLIVRRPLAATLAAQLGVLPLSVYYFSQISLIAPVANLVILALVVPVNILSLALIFSGGFFTPLAWVIGRWISWLLFAMTRVAALAAEIPLATLTIPSVGVTGVILLYLWLAWLSSKPWWLSPRQRTGLSLSIALGLVILWWHPWPYRWTVTILDVGQGDAIFMRMPNGRSVLVDGGGRTSPLPETVGQRVVVPFLRRQGVQHLDLMVVSHPHEDHYRGLMAVTESMPVKTVVISPSSGIIDANYQQWISSLTKSRIATVSAGDQIVLDPRVRIEVLAPERTAQDYVDEGGVNKRSLVLR
ncbi:MAG: ComEC/Rec2 family competence protein, partial [Bacillota bacterium]